MLLIRTRTIQPYKSKRVFANERSKVVVFLKNPLMFSQRNIFQYNIHNFKMSLILHFTNFYGSYSCIEVNSNSIFYTHTYIVHLITGILRSTFIGYSYVHVRLCTQVCFYLFLSWHRNEVFFSLHYLYCIYFLQVKS